MSATEFLDNLAHQLRSQDNRYTSYPVYEVQEKVRVTGIDTDYTEDVLWISPDSEIVGNDPEFDDLTHDQLEALHNEGSDVPDGYTRTGYAERWEQRESFLTLEAAESYIKTNKHRHDGELRVYVDSAYRNKEWQELRRLLAGPVQDCITALRDVTAELVQLHAHHYQNCEGGCPAHTYVGKAQAAMNALNEFQDPYR